MKLTKSIILLQQDLDDSGSVNISDLNKAQELAIEALKVLTHGRLIGAHHDPELLSGETK